jgi:hypothetical protein
VQLLPTGSKTSSDARHDWSEQRAKGGCPKLLGIMRLPRDTRHPGAPELARNANLLIIDGIPRDGAPMGLGAAGC